MKDFVRGTLSAYNISSERTRVSLVTFGEKAVTNLYLKDGIDKDVVEKFIGNLTKIGGKRNVIDALKFVSKNTLAGKVDYGRLLVLVTTGPESKSTNTDERKMILNELKANDITILVIGIGDEASGREIKEIAGDDNTVVVRDADQLQTTVPKIARKSGDVSGMLYLVFQEILVTIS